MPLTIPVLYNKSLSVGFVKALLICPMELQKYFKNSFEKGIYLEKTFKGTKEEYIKALETSSTIYVGGLPSSIKEERLWHLFQITGPIRRIIMGVNKCVLTGCGFCFVEYEKSSDAESATVFFKDFCLDRSQIKVDKDWGFIEGRQYGRGMFGGTVKADERKRRRF